MTTVALKNNQTYTLNPSLSPVRFTIGVNSRATIQAGAPFSLSNSATNKITISNAKTATYELGANRVWYLIEGSVDTIPASEIVGQPLTVTSDTNVIITATGTIATALLKAVNLALSWTGILSIARGGTGLSSVSQGDLLYGSASNTLSVLAKDTNSTRYLANTGSSNSPQWAQVDLTNGVTGVLPVANGGTGQGTYKPALVLGSSVTVTSHTGDTAETIFDTFLIPANTLVEGDRICFSVWFSKTGTTNTFNPRVRINTSAAVGGTILYNPGASATNTVFAMCENKYLTIRSATVTQYAVVITAREAPFTVGGFGTGALNTVNIDWTADQYLVITGQLGGSAVDTIKCTGYLVVKY